MIFLRFVFTGGNRSSVLHLQCVCSIPTDFSGCPCLLCTLGRLIFPNTFVQVAGGIKTEPCNSNYMGDLDAAELSYTIINFFLKCGPLTYF